jgi:hypothetical protein
MHRNTPHAYFGPAQTPPWTPLHSKCAHTIRHLRSSESARISWTSEYQPLAHQNASYRALHWSCVACSCTRPQERSARVLWPCQKRAANLLQSYGARNGTSHSARNSCLSDQSLAHQHQNASCQAVYEPGVAAQVNAFLTRALGIILTRMPGSLCTQRCLQHGTIDSARSSRAHHRPLVNLNAP